MKTHQSVKEQYQNYVMNTYMQNDIVLVRGQGARVWDINGREYLDFASGISVCNLGHCHPRVTAAIQAQAGELVHVSNLFMHPQHASLAEKLIRHSMDGVVFFANSGAEANEGLIKFARKWGNPQGKNEIVVMDDSFHGRTLATLAATGRSKYRQGFEPDTMGFKHVPFNNFEAIQSAVDEKTCAVLLECVQGEGGVLPADKDYIQKVREFCTAKGILLLMDEVQAGIGRTGTMFSWQNYGVEPDAFSCAKALANGFPMGCFIVKREYANVLGPGTHASTFGGTPLACAAAEAVIDTIVEENILAHVNDLGDYIRAELSQKLSNVPLVKGVRGMGLFIGIVLDRAPGEFLAPIREKGLIVLPAGETVIRLLPPLTITKADADEAIAIIVDVLSNYKLN